MSSRSPPLSLSNPSPSPLRLYRLLILYLNSEVFELKDPIGVSAHLHCVLVLYLTPMIGKSAILFSFSSHRSRFPVDQAGSGYRPVPSQDTTTARSHNRPAVVSFVLIGSQCSIQNLVVFLVPSLISPVLYLPLPPDPPPPPHQNLQTSLLPSALTRKKM